MRESSSPFRHQSSRGEYVISTMESNCGQWETLVFSADREAVLELRSPSKPAALLTHLHLERNGWAPEEDEGVYLTPGARDRR